MPEVPKFSRKPLNRLDFERKLGVFGYAVECLAPLSWAQSSITSQRRDGVDRASGARKSAALTLSSTVRRASASAVRDRESCSGPCAQIVRPFVRVSCTRIWTLRRRVGGAEAILDRAERAYDSGDFRWVVEVVNHVIFADPQNVRAREIQIKAFTQLGYQSESATYRNSYLTGAHELRVGAEKLVTLNEGHKVNDHQLPALLTPEHIADFMAVRLRAESLAGLHIRINWEVADLNETWLLEISNRALHASLCEAPDVDAVLTATRADIWQVISEALTLDQALAQHFKVSGGEKAVRAVFEALDRYVSGFAIVEP